jgi:hypothetical protein
MSLFWKKFSFIFKKKKCSFQTEKNKNIKYRQL